jgi:hypothetical protein
MAPHHRRQRSIHEQSRGYLTGNAGGKVWERRSLSSVQSLTRETSNLEDRQSVDLLFFSSLPRNTILTMETRSSVRSALAKGVDSLDGAR